MDGKMNPPTSVGSRKRQNLTLDLDTATRKNKMQSLLESPDVQMLKLTSPEMEKFLNQNPSLATPTPTGYYFPKAVTEEQILYAKGFEEALEQVKQADSSQSEAANTLVGLSTAVVNHYSSSDDSAPSIGIPSSVPGGGIVDSRPVSPPRGNEKVLVKEEPDDSASLVSGSREDSLLQRPASADSYSPGLEDSNVSPIDMENQEMIKLERKRMRNRMAASKCRKRKLERIAQLDERVKQLKNENADLAAVVSKMKTSVAQLKQEVIKHVNSGCEIRVADSSFAGAS